MKKYFESRAKNFFNLGWSHGRHFDYWSFVHFLTGVILGIGAMIISSHNIISFIIILVGLIAYEIIEIITKVVEDFENVLTDIILGAIGSAVAIFFLPDIISKQNIYLVLSLCIITNLICLFFGWKNYLKKKSSQSSSHGYILYTLYFIYIFGILIAVVSFYYWLTNFFP